MTLCLLNGASPFTASPVSDSPVSASTVSALPVASYSDPAIFAAEQARIFANSPRYVGHASLVPNPLDYAVLPALGEGYVLIRQADGSLKLLSNVCRHRQAVLLKGRGNLTQTTGGQVVCPLHRWTYDAAGVLLGAPQFDANPCLHLPEYPLHEWNGLLFTGDRAPSLDLAGLAAATELDFSHYKLGRTLNHACDYNWKTFIEVYLEDYHVAPSHPGLSRFVDCSNLAWQFGEHFSVQTVGVSPQFHSPATPAYQAWHDAVTAQLEQDTSQHEVREQAKPAHGAIWLTYYPTIMIEWYPNVLTVSTLHPIGPNQTMNVVDFYYPEHIADFEPDYMAAQQAAYLETCAEDDDFAQRMDAGRAALVSRGADDAGPYQHPMEDGMVHFHAWWRGKMADRLCKPVLQPLSL